MTIRDRKLVRAAGMFSAAAIAGVMLVACTPGGSQADGPASPGSPSKTATATPGPGVETPVDPAKVPPLETAPPVTSTNEPGRQDSVLESLPGEDKAGCVEVGSERDVRSGSMAAGNFADARADFSASPTSAIPFYFIPVDLTGDPELVVELERLDGSGSDEIRSTQIQTADEWRYYPVMITIPAKGKWEIKASAGSASAGCWIAAFSS